MMSSLFGSSSSSKKPPVSPVPPVPPVSSDIKDLSLGDQNPIAAADTLDVINDFELVNLLNVHLSDSLGDGVRQQHDEVKQNIVDWLAWEAKTVDDAVTGKIKSHELPADTSVTSALKRNDYRGKVLQYYREHGAWLTDASASSGAKSLPLAHKDAASTVVHHITTILPPAFQELRLVLFPIIRSLFQGANKAQKYIYTFVRHSYDDVAKTVRSVVWQLNIEIDVKAAGSNVEVSVKHVLTSFNFAHSLWEKQSKVIKTPVVDAGKTILSNYTLHLAK